MVAPIALYPDPLVAQVLAASTLPGQVGAARDWSRQNPGLTGDALAEAANQQAWDPSLKSLTAFPEVLDQLAGNLSWTGALGQAYLSRPDDVMAAIQALRHRARQAGTLQNSAQLRVADDPGAPREAPGAAADAMPPAEAPQAAITIEAAQPQFVHVPAYDPRAAYGEPIAYPPGYEAAAPAPAAGVIAFGTTVVVDARPSRHDWGWRAWNMRWGRPQGPHPHRPHPPSDRERPAVVFNQSPYAPGAPGGPPTSWRSPTSGGAPIGAAAQQAPTPTHPRPSAPYGAQPRWTPPPLAQPAAPPPAAAWSPPQPPMQASWRQQREQAMQQQMQQAQTQAALQQQRMAEAARQQQEAQQRLQMQQQAQLQAQQQAQLQAQARMQQMQAQAQAQQQAQVLMQQRAAQVQAHQQMVQRMQPRAEVSGPGRGAPAPGDPRP